MPEENIPPKIEKISIDPGASCFEPAAEVAVYAKVSDPDGDDLSLSWGGDGQFDPTLGKNQKRVIWKAPSTPGTYTIQLTISDGEFTVTGTKDVTVADPVAGNGPPQVDALDIPSSMNAGEQKIFSVVASDPDGDALKYSWQNSCEANDNVQGKFSQATEPSTTYQAPITRVQCEVTVTIRDSASQRSSGGSSCVPDGITAVGKIVNVHGYAPVFSFGEKGSCGTSAGCGPGELLFPTSIDIDASGKVFVADAGDAKVKVFSSSGAFLQLFPEETSCTRSAGSLCAPRDLVLGGSDLFLTEDDKNIVMRFDPGFQLKQVFGQKIFQDGFLDSPGTIARDSQANIYVMQADQCTVSKFSPEGVFLFKFNTSCESTISNLDHESGFLPGIAVNSQDRIFVSDPRQHRLVIFDQNGNLLTCLPPCSESQSGDEPGEFSFPAQIVFDSKDRLYVADKGNHRIQVFNPLTETDTDLASKLYTVFGEEGSGEGQLQDPLDVAIAPNSDLYVLDTGNHRVQVFRFQSP